MHHLKKAFTEEPSWYNALVLMEMVSLTDVYVHLDFDWETHNFVKAAS